MTIKIYKMIIQLANIGNIRLSDGQYFHFSRIHTCIKYKIIWWNQYYYIIILFKYIENRNNKN